MCAVLIEHSGGKLPFWLSPRQCIVLPISDKVNEYAEKVEEALKLSGKNADAAATEAATAAAVTPGV